LNYQQRTFFLLPPDCKENVLSRTTICEIQTLKLTLHAIYLRHGNFIKSRNKILVYYVQNTFSLQQYSLI